MNDYYWLNENSRLFLSRGYLSDGVEPEDRIKEIAENAESILKISGFAKKFQGYMARGFYSLSTPVWSNFGNTRGLPVSCFGSYISDNMTSILSTVSEVGMMSKMGGGTSAYFGELRHRGSKIGSESEKRGESSGPVHFMELFDKVSTVISQGSTRRGAFAAYLPIEHKDAEDFLKIQSKGNSIQDMSFGVTITDDFMNSMLNGDSDKRKLWASIIKKRYETGYPYIFFTDTVNNNAPQVYKDKNLKIRSSNLCSEICLSSNEENSFVCVLSSLNLVHWDEIIQTDAIETLIYFLDAVNEEFIFKSNDVSFLNKANHFARTQRALGAGILGWHSLLQSKMIPFESMEAKYLNVNIWSNIKNRADIATRNLAKIFGEPELLKGYGIRNVTTLAVAPTTSSSFILGQVSQSIEPLNSNYFINASAKGKFTYKNEYLKKLLSSYNKDNDDVWESILIKNGSVQHLNFLSDNEKNIFKTFKEISQADIIIQAAQRQKFIDQAQSLNINIPPSAPPKEVSELLINGWKMGIKTFYYQRSENPAQELVRNILTCSSCES